VEAFGESDAERALARGRRAEDRNQPGHVRAERSRRRGPARVRPVRRG
jgi:hypothetical protein